MTIKKMTIRKYNLLPLILATVLTLTGCGRLVKPELTPQIHTSAPPATNLRTQAVPEGMSSYDSLPAMKQAWLDLDPNLGDIDAAPILEMIPAGLSPAYSANPEEVMVVYSDDLNIDRSVTLYGYFSDDPQSLLEDFSQESYFEGSTIGGEDFHILAEHADDANREAYTMTEDWFIHIFASGFSAEEFTEILNSLKLVPFY